MAIFSTAKELRNALNDVQPSKIAVAFIGSGWGELLSSNNLKEIILSPTVGSNPYAIEQIIKKLGINNVHFLDNLHAKIYIGAESALLGSCNLSNNGFSDGGNFEAGVMLNKQANLDKLESIFKNYKAEAKCQYPTIESKKERLKKLHRDWQKSKEFRTDSTLVNYGEGEKNIASISISSLDRIHIEGWSEDLIYNEKIVRRDLPEVNNPTEYFFDSMSFDESKKIEQGNWILSWKCTQNGNLDKRANIRWIYVHHVISDGAENEGYTKLAGQAKNLDCPLLPFKLDKATKNIIRDALNLPKFAKIRDADNFVPEFLTHLQNEAGKQMK